MEYIRTPAEAERNAAEQMRRLGYADAQAVPGGPDGGIDVRSARAVAQVKWRGGAVGRPELQNLYGARGADHHKDMYFFAASAYTDHAIQYANLTGMRLYLYDPTGEITPVNRIAQPARFGSSPALLGFRSSPNVPKGFWRSVWAWLVPFWQKHWRIICAIFFTTSVVVAPFDGEQSIAERVAITLISLICAPIFWKLHLDHRRAQRDGV